MRPQNCPRDPLYSSVGRPRVPERGQLRNMEETSDRGRPGSRETLPCLQFGACLIPVRRLICHFFLFYIGLQEHGSLSRDSDRSDVWHWALMYYDFGVTGLLH